MTGGSTRRQPGRAIPAPADVRTLTNGSVEASRRAERPTMRIIGLVGSPDTGGRTSTAVTAVLRGATHVDTELIELSATSTDRVVAAVAAADAVVFGSPVYRGTYSALLKSTLEATERGKWGETSAPLQGKVAATVLTGATPHHYLAMNDLRNVLAGFFAVQVLSPGMYVDHSD